MAEAALTLPLIGAVPLKYVSLLLLMLQNCTQVIVMRYSRTSGEEYSAGVAIACI